MFRNAVSQTALTTEVAHRIFGEKVVDKRGHPFKGDVTFLSTLRALVMPRMAEGDTLIFETFGVRYSNNISIAKIIDSTAVQLSGTFTVIHDTNEDESVCDKVFERVSRDFTTTVEGYERLEKISVFFKGRGEEGYFRVLCFLNPELKSVVLLTSNIDSLKKWHFLQLAIVPSLPWYFKENQPTEDPERGLCTSLRGTDSEVYLEYINLIANQYDFRSGEIRHLLEGFEALQDKELLVMARRSLNRCDENINDRQSDISRLLRDREEICVKVMGLEAKISNNDGHSELMDYFLCNSSLVLDKVDGTKLTFSVKGYSSYFDKEVVTAVLNNPHGYFYEQTDGRCYPGIGAQKMEKLIKSIFVDEVLRLKICAAYSLEMGGQVSAQEGYDFRPELVDFLPNPHINDFSCMGNYQTGINEALRDNDYIGAVSQCAASSGSLNFMDSHVMKRFMSYLYSTNKRCIALPDGSSVSVDDAINWLETQESTEIELVDDDASKVVTEETMEVDNNE